METQEELNIGIGTEEATILQMLPVKIEKVSIDIVGTKGSKKLSCECKHPQKADGLIIISAVKQESKGKLETVGLWINKDSKGLLRKGSALANFMTYLKVATIQDLIGKEIGTVQDENGYLVFKAY
jgi:hypothetical protein